MPSIGISWVPQVGWMAVLAIMGGGISISIPLGVAATAVAAVGAGLAGATAASYAGYYMLHGAVEISWALYQWAVLNGARTIPRNIIDEERQREGFDSNATHIAVCGPAGSGKSSIVNALMGIPNDNRNPQTAKTGTTETTTQRGRYAAHYRLGFQFLYDFPGAGTYTVPDKNYYYNHRLWLYDRLIIVHGERFGAVEIATVAACILHRQAFAIVRSRSDRVIHDMMEDDGDLNIDTAKQQHQIRTAEAIGQQLRLADCKEEQILEAMRFCFVVNKVNLRGLTAMDASAWPFPPGNGEIHERALIQFLGYGGPGPMGATAEAAGPAAAAPGNG